ncbi:hypothetical protein BBF96_11835 [Anoxybacter fermentans]|uniref:CRISPR type III-associated protein domain-containing protein n=1 Tax=Anoxybacter fermentans TaxID=1323375 RepID=A0A3S9T091_9FIRM|nr:RAMP superfamily CRISPR-associated protein [Anoxybacter fermentans]AZR74023.1 hypothetical protein BBF96_11835 [Anoxybacter fermentans]
MNLKVKIKNSDREIELQQYNLGKMKMWQIPIEIEVEKGSFLHIGAAPSPLSDKKGAIFKINRTPAIPATSFKGALRHQLELLVIEKIDYLANLFSVFEEDFEKLKPCIPSPNPTKAEQDLIEVGLYRGKVDKNKYTGYCLINVDKSDHKNTKDDMGVCPVCYFMGAGGIMGFLRIPNFNVAAENDIILDQVNIRIDRKTRTAAKSAKVDMEQVIPGTRFSGILELIDSTPLGFEFGRPREIQGNIIDKWLKNWKEEDIKERKRILIEEFLIPALENIRELGGQKSKGAGRVIVKIKEKNGENHCENNEI